MSYYFEELELQRAVAWIFVCQVGRLSPQACVLAASLRKNLGASANLIASIPTPKSVMGDVTSIALEFLGSLGVQCVESPNQLFIESFPGETISMLMMNKAFSLELAGDSGVSVFLDSDQICHAPFESFNLAVPMVGRCVGYRGARASEGLWESAYNICEVSAPQERYLIQKGNSGVPFVVTYPYFNGGFIAIHQAWRRRFIDCYLDCYKRLSSQNLLGEDRFFEEQMALSLAVLKSGVPYEVDLRRISQSFLHYHSAERLFTLPKYRKYVIELTAEYPMLRDILHSYSDWRLLLEPAK